MTNSDTQNNSALEERKFLHDLSSPLNTALLLSEIMATNPQIEPNLKSKLLDLGKCLETCIQLVEKRRSILKK